MQPARRRREVQSNTVRRILTTGGFAASFVAMNQVFGEFFDVRPIAFDYRDRNWRDRSEERSRWPNWDKESRMRQFCGGRH